MEVKAGDKIKIISINDIANPHYAGKIGVVTKIYKDPWGDVRIEGTWGGICLYPCDGDKFEIIERGWGR